MTSVVAKITSKGQMTLPKEVRKLLGVGAGDSVRFEIAAGQVRVYPEKPIPDFSAMIGQHPLGPEWDGINALDTTEELRGSPEDRAALHAAPPHPNVVRLSEVFTGLQAAPETETETERPTP